MNVIDNKGFPQYVPWFCMTENKSQDLWYIMDVFLNIPVISALFYPLIHLAPPAKKFIKCTENGWWKIKAVQI
jgi:hypothetical protein